jgi:hypothetical protein
MRQLKQLLKGLLIHNKSINEMRLFAKCKHINEQIER